MEKNTKTMSLTDALRNGISLEDIRKTFEATLQDAQNEIAVEKKAQEAKACKKCGNCGELDLDTCREDMLYATLDYLTVLGLIPEDMEIKDDDIDGLINMIKEIEDEYKAKLDFMKTLSAVAKELDKEEKVNKKKTADDVIAQFLKGLH